MFKSSLLRYGPIAALLITVATPSMARPPHEHPYPPMDQHRPGPMHSYDRGSLPDAASFLVISGITYALIDGLFYQRSSNSDKYIYVENPPVSTQQTTTVIHTSGVTGSVVDVLPGGVKTVSVNGVVYYVKGSHWYAPIAGSSRFVIVDPQI